MWLSSAWWFVSSNRTNHPSKTIPSSCSLSWWIWWCKVVWMWPRSRQSVELSAWLNAFTLAALLGKSASNSCLKKCVHFYLTASTSATIVSNLQFRNSEKLQKIKFQLIVQSLWKLRHCWKWFSIGSPLRSRFWKACKLRNTLDLNTTQDQMHMLILLWEP